MDLGHLNYVAIIVLMMVGLWAMIAKRNLYKKVIGMTIFQTAIIFFYIASSVRSNTTIPILIHEHGGGPHAYLVDPTLYTNPLPHVLMLTAIVVGVATLGLALVMIQRLYTEYGSLEEDEILDQLED